MKEKDRKMWPVGEQQRILQSGRVYDAHVFMQVVERVPHRGHNLRHFAEAGARILTFDRRLRVAEKQRVRRYRPETQHRRCRHITWRRRRTQASAASVSEK